MSIFTAIDFETANRWHGSVCALGIVRVENDAIVDKKVSLIDPQIEDEFWNTGFTNDCHSISVEMVRDAPTFDKVWRSVEPMLEGADFIAAHNAFRFDKLVLEECCRRYKLTPPQQPFKCSFETARACWKLDSYAFNDVCEHLGIELNHHEPLSDAIACAKIMISSIHNRK